MRPLVRLTRQQWTMRFPARSISIKLRHVGAINGRFSVSTF